MENRPNLIIDQNQRVIYQEMNGQWVKFTYDRMGNVIFYEDSRGNWKKSEYDKYGKLTYEENSLGQTNGTKRKQ